MHVGYLFTATMVARTRLIVTLYVQYIACLVFEQNTWQRWNYWTAFLLLNRIVSTILFSWFHSQRMKFWDSVFTESYVCVTIWRPKLIRTISKKAIRISQKNVRFHYEENMEIVSLCVCVCVCVWKSYKVNEYVEIKCQLDATDDFYCTSYCLLNTFRAPLCTSSGARGYYTSGCCLWYLVLWFSSCRYGVELRVMCQVCRLLL